MTLRKEIKKIILNNKTTLFINLFFSCLLAFSGPFALYAQAYFIDKIESMIETRFIISQLIQPTLLLLLSYLLPMSNIITNFISMKYNHSLDLSWNKQINELISNIPYYKYEREETYDKIKQICENNIYREIISCIFSFFLIIVSILLYIFILFNISIWLSLSVIVLAPAVGCFTSKIADKQYKKTYKMNPDRRRSIYKSSILRSREFAKDIRLNRCTDYMLNDWEYTQKAIDLKVLKIKFKYGFLSALVEKNEYLVIFINLIIVLFSYLNGNITIGVFISVSNQIFSMRILTKIQSFVSQLTKIKSLCKTYSEVLCLTQVRTKHKEEILLKEPVIVEFKNVYFKYSNQEKFMLNNINLQFHTGESIAIVGANGAGKSTLIKLLLGLYVPNKGEILINGNNVSDLSLSEKSKNFGVVFQDFAKFNLSLKENITLGKDEQDFMQKALHLNVNELANSLSDGYLTLLGKSFGNAVDVSVGQWQLIAITRALIGEKNILVFDEPTASLDPIKEVEILESIKLNMQNKISIFITHRLGITTKVDRIILIKDNQIIENGSFNELMEENGEFKKMFEMQKSLYKKENVP